MQIEVKEIESGRVLINYEADAEEILNKRGSVLEQFKKSNVPGCRPGRAPIDSIKLYYKKQIEDALKKALIEDAYHNTIFEKKFRPHGAPMINSALLQNGKFNCEFVLNVKPDFELAPYKGLEVVKPSVAKTVDEMAESMIQDLRMRYGAADPYVEGDFVQKGDNVILDYDAFVDGIKVENLCAQGVMLTVGNAQIPGFDDNLLGIVLGDTHEFDVAVPEGALPSLSGKTIHFKVTVNMGSKVIPCALDDEFAKKLNKGSYAELRQAIQQVAESRCGLDIRMATNEVIVKRLVQDNVFNVPNWLIISEAKYLAHTSKLEWDNILDQDKEHYLQLAEKNVKLSLILDRIREMEPEAQLTDQEVFEMIKQNLAKTQQGADFDNTIKEMNRTGYLQILFSRIRDEYTLDFIGKEAKIVE